MTVVEHVIIARVVKTDATLETSKSDEQKFA
jgi:hypothetical protein